MAISKETINQMIYDPTAMQKFILDELDKATQGEYAVVEPTNPFSMAIETAVVCAASAVQETTNQIRKQYPNLASSNEDLYHHLTENETTYIFATPSEVKMRFFVNTIDLRQNGVEYSNYRETIIPAGTAITTLDITMTTLNDILVRLYSNNEVYIEQQVDPSNDIAYDNISMITGELLTDSNGTSWIMFETWVKQVTKQTINKAIVRSSGFSQVIPIEDMFCHASVKYKASNSNDYVELNKLFTDEYIDHTQPSVIVKVYDGQILFKIPDHFILEGVVTGNIKIDIWTTKGKQYLPLNNYQVDDFKYVLGDTGKSKLAATSKNIAMMMVSSSILEGGSNSLSNEELRKIIINNTTGDIDLPITEKQIERLGNISGYTVSKNLDIITQREFIGLKSIPSIDSNFILCDHTIFFNTAKIVIGELNNSNVIVNSSNFLIKSGSVFKNNNGDFQLLTDSETEYVDSLPNNLKINYLKENKLFYTPFYYLIEKSEEFVNSRVYDLDNPVVIANRIIDKNITLEERVNVDKYALSKVKEGYRLSITLITNSAFDKLETKSIFAQIKIPLFGGSSYAYIDGTYEASANRYDFLIKTNFSINEDGSMELLNGYSLLSHKEIKLISELHLYIWTTDAKIKDSTSFLLGEIYSGNKHVTVLDKELFKIEFGKELKYIFNNMYSIYSERKYRRYEEDIPLVYEQDVYKVDDDTGCIVDVTNGADGNPEASYEILHHRGDNVLDENGNPIIKFKKGDTMLNNNGDPIIDLDNGVIRYIDILMLEYEFRISDSNAYNNYTSLVTTTLKEYILEELPEMNNKLLEQTIIKYKSYHTTGSINAVVNNVTKSIPNNCSPVIELYVTNTDTIDNNTKQSYIKTIGSILNEYFSNSKIVMEDIRNEIKTKLGTNISGVKISGITQDNYEIITVNNIDNRFYLNKLLSVNKNNELIPIYDITINFIYI